MEATLPGDILCAKSRNRDRGCGRQQRRRRRRRRRRYRNAAVQRIRRFGLPVIGKAARAERSENVFAGEDGKRGKAGVMRQREIVGESGGVGG